MKAILVNEALEDVLKGKSREEIERDFERNRIQDHFSVLKESVNELLNNDDLIFSDFVITFDKIKRNFIETAISDYLKKELGILFVLGNNKLIALLDNGFKIQLQKSNSGYSYQPFLINNLSQMIDTTSQCRNMRTLKSKIQKMLKYNNISK